MKVLKFIVLLMVAFVILSGCNRIVSNENINPTESSQTIENTLKPENTGVKSFLDQKLPSGRGIQYDKEKTDEISAKILNSNLLDDIIPISCVVMNSVYGDINGDGNGDIALILSNVDDEKSSYILFGNGEKFEKASENTNMFEEWGIINDVELSIENGQVSFVFLCKELVPYKNMNIFAYSKKDNSILMEKHISWCDDSFYSHYFELGTEIVGNITFKEAGAFNSLQHIEENIDIQGKDYTVSYNRPYIDASKNENYKKAILKQLNLIVTDNNSSIVSMSMSVIEKYRDDKYITILIQYNAWELEYRDKYFVIDAQTFELINFKDLYSQKELADAIKDERERINTLDEDYYNYTKLDYSDNDFQNLAQRVGTSYKDDVPMVYWDYNPQDKTPKLAISLPYVEYYTPKYGEVVVDTVEELLLAIQDNVHIKVQPGIYNITSAMDNLQTNNKVFSRECYDGEELVISNINNLAVEGVGKGQIQILVEPRYADVVTFLECSNVYLNNLYVGHTDTGECAGGVLAFNKSSQISINDLELFGCGTVGIEAENTSDLKMNNSIIRNCSEGFMRLTNCQNVLVNNTSFNNTEIFTGFTFNQSKNIVFDNCKIKDNYGYDGNTSGDMFSNNGSEVVVFNNCLFENNRCQASISRTFGIEFTETEFKSNAFDDIVKHFNEYKLPDTKMEDMTVGEVSWGMSLEEVENVLDVALLDLKDEYMPVVFLKYPTYIYTYGDMLIGFDSNNKVNNLYTDSPNITTSKGIKVGDTLDTIFETYGYAETNEDGIVEYYFEPKWSELAVLYFKIENEKIVALGLGTSGY